MATSTFVVLSLLLAGVLAVESAAKLDDPMIPAVIKFIGIQHGYSNDSEARATLEKSLSAALDRAVIIDEFEMQNNGLVVWHLQRLRDCDEHEMKQVLALIRNQETSAYTRHFKMLLGPEFSHPRRVELEWRGPCENLDRKRTLKDGNSLAGAQQRTSNSTGDSSEAPPTTTTTTEITTTEELSAPSSTSEPPQTVPEGIIADATSAATEEPMNSSLNLSTPTDAPFQQVDPNEFLTSNASTTSEAAATFTLAITTTTTTATTTTTTPASSSTAAGVATVTDAASNTTADDPTRTNTTTEDPLWAGFFKQSIPDEQTDASSSGPAEVTTSLFESLASDATSDSGSVHNESQSDPTSSSSPASASAAASSPHYGKYIGLTTGFFVFIAYLLCARAYRRQGMYELQEST